MSKYETTHLSVEGENGKGINEHEEDEGASWDQLPAKEQLKLLMEMGADYLLPPRS